MQFIDRQIDYQVPGRAREIVKNNDKKMQMPNEMPLLSRQKKPYYLYHLQVAFVRERSRACKRRVSGIRYESGTSIARLCFAHPEDRNKQFPIAALVQCAVTLQEHKYSIIIIRECPCYHSYKTTKNGWHV